MYDDNGGGGGDVWLTAHDDDVRSTRPRSGVSSHRQPMWNGLSGAKYPQTESVHRELVDPVVRQHLSVPRETTAAV